MRHKSHVKRQRASRETSRITKADPRANQRMRTRSAITEAARRLLLAGKVPSVAEAAEQASVSRATAYRYFPSQGSLVQEAVETVMIAADQWEEHLAGTGGVAGRAERLAAKVFELTRHNEALVRGALLLSLQQWTKLQSGEDLSEPPIRRGGRLEGIDAALTPFRKTLGPRALRRLRIALSLLVGIESRIVLRDILELDEDEAVSVVQWMARALASAALREPE